MLRFLRHFRALAVTLLLAAPGLGGTWLSLAHPCPVDMPWLAAEPQGDGAHSQHSHEDAGHGSSGSCSCVGACQGGSAALNHFPAHRLISVATTGWDASPSASEHDAPVQRISHRLPPATAPPQS